MTQREANGRETGAMLLLALLDTQLRADGAPLEARLRGIPDGWRRYRLASTLVDRLVRELYDTLPLRQLESLGRMMRGSQVSIKPRQAAPGRQARVVSDEDIEMLIARVLAGECAICFRAGSAVRGCGLRKALMGIAPPQALLPEGCAYRDVALDAEDGNFFGEGDR